MIVYDLVCELDHRFEGWFQNIKDFETQCDSGQIQCPMCASALIRRLPSVLSVGSSAHVDGNRIDKTIPQRSLSAEVETTDQKVRAIHRYVKENFDDVGSDFTEQARKIHHGLVENRNIWGHATQDQVNSLYEDGIPALPLPPDPSRKEKLN